MAGDESEVKRKSKNRMKPTQDTKSEGLDMEFDQKELADFVNNLGLSKFNTLPQKPNVPVDKTKKLSDKSNLKNNTKLEKKLKPESNKKKLVDQRNQNATAKPNQSVNLSSGNKIKQGTVKTSDTNTKKKFPNDNAKLRKNSKNQKALHNNSSSEVASNKSKNLLIKPDEKWFDLLQNVQSDKNGLEHEDIKPLNKFEIKEFENKASKLIDADAQLYKSVSLQGEQKSDFHWMDKIMKTGTLPDRMAAFTIRIQDSPIHNLYCLQQLISNVKIQGKHQCLTAADTVRDLFLEELLPPDRKLIPFDHRGTMLKTASQKQLLVWLFEGRLKALYKQFIDALRQMSSDTVDKLRGKAISIIQELLAAHPEQETILLEMLVNKLGDPIKKVGSRALFHLSKLVEMHPTMKIVVVKEVERLLFRNNISPKAQYYGICFLNSIRLDAEDPQLSTKLISVYLAFFKGCVKTGEIDSKMMSALLTGLNKAYPSAKLNGFKFNEGLDTLFKIVHLSQFNIGIQALCILYQLIDVKDNEAAADRFYRVLYEKIMSSEFVTTAHNMQFLNLIFKSMKKDTIKQRVIGFTKRLLQICQNVQPNLACAILFLISEVSKTHEGIICIGEVTPVKNISTADDVKAESNEDSDSDSFSDLKKRNKKSTKAQNKADLNNLLKTSNVKIDEDPKVDHSEMPKTTKNPISVREIEVLDCKDVQEIKDEKQIESRTTVYDPIARNPTYCGAELTLAYELATLCHHFHPSVALYAQILLNRNKISYDGNPLKDFTVSRFLERFVFRNVKLNKTRPAYQPQGLRSLAVNSTKYLEVDEDKVPEEEKFFYKYFKGKSIKKEPKDKEDKDDSDLESVDDEEFDDIMGNYFKSPKHTVDSEDDDDVDFAVEVQNPKKQGNKNIDSDSDEEGEEGEEEDDEDDDDFMNLDDDEEEDVDDDDLMKLDDEDDSDMEAIDMDDDDDYSDDKDFDTLKRIKPKVKSKRTEDMFAPADQFAHMLEENADDVLSGTQTFINADKSDKKQIKWEMDRERWMKGYKRSNKMQRKSDPRKKRKFV